MSHPIPTLTTTGSLPSGADATVGDHYTFGDGGDAAERLALLAAVFEPSSARLLRLLGYLQPRQAVDLGCGPGWSTRLVHAVLAPARTLGLERSPQQVARARAMAPPGVEYQVRDVTEAAFPGERRPDLLYSRFLLTHLRDPDEVVAAWGRAAADRAVLVLEETADMLSEHPAFARYYQLVAELQAAYGQCLRVGAALAGPFAGWTTELSLLSPLSLPATRMARLHALNIATWRNDPYARAAFDGDELDRLAASLAAIADHDEPAPPVRVVMRQLVLAKP
ncbi:MAG TPA: class I SAM-dependent methyltransferase [Polyangia bacterium]|jgi:SAM-dependent methyltransferase|nr:class I SAM-dependent methyltransferase [Polyangia bacterium]